MNRLEAIKAFLQEDPDDPFSRFALAQEYRKLGQSDEAIAAFEALVADHPNYVGTYYHLGKLYEEAGRKEDAVGTYQSGIERSTAARDYHARSELQSALLEARGIGFDDEE